MHENVPSNRLSGWIFCQRRDCHEQSDASALPTRSQICFWLRDFKKDALTMSSLLDAAGVTIPSVESIEGISTKLSLSKSQSC